MVVIAFIFFLYIFVLLLRADGLKENYELCRVQREIAPGRERNVDANCPGDAVRGSGIALIGPTHDS